jgi:hypothetical protein
VQLWVQIHNAPLQQMTKKAIKQVAQEVSDLVDPHLEGADKWDTFSIIRLDINSDKGLKDRLDICLPYGKERTTLIHYERLVRVCLYCAKIGHEVEHCDERIRLLSRIKHYPPELHEVLNEKLRPRCGGWIGKIYLLNRYMPDLNKIPLGGEGSDNSNDSRGFGPECNRRTNKKDGHDTSVGIRNAQIPLMLKLRKDRRTKILLLLKLGIKVCRIITESYRHLILYKRR